MPVSTVTLEPATFEVLKNKLQAIVNEQTITLKLVSGSPIVTESGDFNTGIYLPDCTAVVRGQENIGHASTLAHMIRGVIEDCRVNPGIGEGDMFFSNDPWKGASHQSDVAILAPHFYRGEIVAWSGCVCHVLDVGGMTAGSWCVKASECYQEGVAFPPIKIVEKGVLRQDVLNAILNQSRLPFLEVLDLKGMIACNNVAIKRILELVERYGIDAVKEVMIGLVDRAEQGLRRRLAGLPDGIYRGVDFIDHDGHQNKLYRIAVTLTKEGDHMTFDFTGSSPQAPGFINCTMGGMEGGIATPLFITLCYDLPWNGGLLRPVKIIGPKGTICNAERPAPVGGASVMAKRSVMNACTQALSRLVSTSPATRNEARAVAGGTFMTLNLRGVSQYGERYGTMVMDPHACGEGAYPFRDGVDAEGHVGSPRSSIPNVESNEDFAPLLYLYRKLLPDTGGAGKMRGGNTMSLAFSVHNKKTQEAVLCGHGVEMPNSVGLAGGGPGACVVNTHFKETDLDSQINGGRIPRDAARLKGRKVNVGAKPGDLLFRPGDVFSYSFQGGGGWGDPLERAPQRVLQDYIDGAVSAAWARRAYGVVIDPEAEEVSKKETAVLRKRLRAKRLARARAGAGNAEVAGVAARGSVPGGVPAPGPGSGAGAGLAPASGGGAAPGIEFLHPLGEALEVVLINGSKLIRCRCGYRFGPAGANWKDGALKSVVSPAKYGKLVKLHRDLEAREYLCPACGVLHSVEINRKDAPPLCEVELS